MTRRQLLVLWRVLAVAVALTAVAVVAAVVLAEDVRPWTSLSAMGVIFCGFAVTWRHRPRPTDTRWPTRREQDDLAAITAGGPIPSEARRDAALGQTRRRMWSGVMAVPIWLLQALLLGSYSWSPLWLRAGVLPLVVLATAWALHRAGRRIAAIDRYEDTCPAAAPSPTAP